MQNSVLKATKTIANKHTILSIILPFFLLIIIFSNTDLNAQTGDNLGNHKATQDLEMEQQNIDNVKYVNIKIGTGNGVRLWSNNKYSISMGVTFPYRYGPVSSYSIKNNMSDDANRGWTWGVYGQTPIAALNTEGTFQLDKDLFVLGMAKIGNVTTPSGFRLYVEDGILTERLKIASVGSNEWPDFVFYKDYQLNSIYEVEEFIAEQKHLPNVPSAKDVSENGIDLAEMDAVLLRQIEELWLHMIEVKKENEALRKLIEQGK